MKKIFEIKQENKIECDYCDFVIPNDNKDKFPLLNLDEYLNKICPSCQGNLLTEKSYRKYRKFLKTIMFINKYFSWLLIISFKGNKYKVENTTEKFNVTFNKK